MQVEPIIRARFNKFKESYELNNLQDGIAFERFVNHTIYTAHQPDAFSADQELLDKICVGGTDDMGIDGLAIKLNGLLVRSVEDVKDILEKIKRANVEFIFVQSKYKPKFDSGEFNKFSAGMRDFLSEKHLQPMNEKISKLLKIKDFLLSEDVVIMWESNPTVRLYYVAMGKWMDSPHLVALSKQLKSDLEKLNTYEKIDIHFVDSKTLKNICDGNENTFSTVINAIDVMSLTAVRGVENSCIILCYAEEFIKMLTTEDKVIRKSLFNDNVRDFQGVNSVNLEIDRTIQEDPEKFILLNNGITIVCDEFLTSNRAVTIRNPQIVNGCQTSHVIYYANSKRNLKGKVPLSIKIIATKDLDITNQIVRGTNRQTIVYDEAFESTKKFHKDLEDFYNAFSVDYERLYYERRSKQYQNNPRIKQTQKINLRIQTQYFIAIFINKPHHAHRHESKLLKDYANTIFQEKQSLLPYFVSALIFYKYEEIFRNEFIDKKKYYSFKAHLMMIFREIISGNCPDINSEKKIDKYCAEVLKVLKNEKKLRECIKKSAEIFDNCKNTWTKDMGKSYYGMKDIAEFTKLLLKRSRLSGQNEYDCPIDDENRFKGVVQKIIIDRFGNRCGFISRLPDDIFFHSKKNPQIDFIELEGKYVSYRVDTDHLNGKPIAVDVRFTED